MLCKQVHFPPQTLRESHKGTLWNVGINSILASPHTNEKVGELVRALKCGSERFPNIWTLLLWQKMDNYPTLVTIVTCIRNISANCDITYSMTTNTGSGWVLFSQRQTWTLYLELIITESRNLLQASSFDIRNKVTNKCKTTYLYENCYHIVTTYFTSDDPSSDGGYTNCQNLIDQHNIWD